MTDAPERIWVTPTLAKSLTTPHKNVLGEAAKEHIRADHALSLVAEAYEVAAAVCEDAKPAYDGHRDPDRAERENAACDVLSDVADEIRAKIPSDALAAREADRKRVRDEALREGRGVKVEPLSWVYDEITYTHWSEHRSCSEERTSAHTWSANPKVTKTAYDIMEFVDARMITRPGFTLYVGESETRHNTLEEAKAAAQADYERRILSALSPAPVSVGEGARDAIAAQFFDFACQMAEDYDIGMDVAKNDPDLIDACSVYAEAALRALSEGDQTYE